MKFDLGTQANRYVALIALIAFILVVTGTETKYSNIALALALIYSVLQNWKT
jgi:hypothetical protein